MMISTKGRYALRMMIDIASQGEGNRSSLREVSKRQDISMKYLEQLAGPLVAANLLTSTRGARGGYSLARPASEITTGQIIRTAEGSFAPVACLEDDFGVCPRRAECETIEFWEGLEKTVDAYLDGVNLAQLLPKRN